jgi:hypothetical protein
MAATWKETKNAVITVATITALLLMISLMIQLSRLLQQVDSMLPSIKAAASSTVPILPKVDEALGKIVPIIPKLDAVLTDVQPIIPNIAEIVEDVRHDVDTFDSVRRTVDKTNNLSKNLDEARRDALDLFSPVF